MFFDSNYIFFVLIPTLVLSGLAQMYVRSAYAKWGAVDNGSRMNGPQIAQRIMQQAGLTSTGLEATPNELGDHFDPRVNVVRMSPSVAAKPSVASMAIVAHELGHAQQYQQGSALIAMRSFLLPAVQFAPSLSYGMIFMGVFTGLTGLAWLGILLFGLSVIFMLLTLPVEIDASRRALKLLDESGLLVEASDRQGAQSMLTAAAFTYVAAAVTSILTLLYYVSLVNRRN